MRLSGLAFCFSNEKQDSRTRFLNIRCHFYLTQNKEKFCLPERLDIKYEPMAAETSQGVLRIVDDH